VPEATANSYASWVVEAATKNNTDPWIFVAIIDRETGWNPALVRNESNGTCSVGLGQINSIGPCTAAHTSTFTDPHANITRMGQLFYIFRETCRENCQDLGWLRRYNPGSPAYLAAIIQAVKNYHAQNGQPVVLRVPTGVHAPGVLRQVPHRTGHERGLGTRNHPPPRRVTPGRR